MTRCSANVLHRLTTASSHEPLQRQPKREGDAIPALRGHNRAARWSRQRLDAMYEFHAHHGIRAQRGHGRHDANVSVVRWCFADPAIAAAFAKEFAASDG